MKLKSTNHEDARNLNIDLVKIWGGGAGPIGVPHSKFWGDMSPRPPPPVFYAPGKMTRNTTTVGGVTGDESIAIMWRDSFEQLYNMHYNSGLLFIYIRKPSVAAVDLFLGFLCVFCSHRAVHFSTIFESRVADCQGLLSIRFFEEYRAQMMVFILRFRAVCVVDTTCTSNHVVTCFVNGSSIGSSKPTRV